PATARLNVQNIGLVKSFSPPSFQAGGTSTLTITLQNPTGQSYTGVSVSDTLPGTVLTIVPGSASTTCGGTVTTTPPTQPRTVTLAGGTIPPSSSPPTPPGTCTITVQVTAPAGTNAQQWTNTIPAGALTTTQGATNVVPATAPIRVYPAGAGVTGSKNFNPPTIAAGGNSRLRINIAAPLDTALTGFSIIDNLPPNVTISNSTPPSFSNCGAGAVLTATTGATFVQLTNGTIAAGTTCQINVWVTSSVPGAHVNTIHPSDITNNENRTLPGDRTATLNVTGTSDMSVSKAFTPPAVSPNGISTLTITLQNTNNLPLVNVSLTDSLPGNTTNGVLLAPTPNASTNCGSGVVTAVPGTQTISMLGGTIPAQVGGVPGICTISVDVQGVGSPATRTNTIPIANVTGTIQGTTTTINPGAPATANLIITNLSIGIVKAFNPVQVFGGAASTMTIQLDNPNNATLTGITFTDNMVLLETGLVIANPANFNTGTCGGTITGSPGATSFTFSGGTLPPGGNCEITLSVTMTVNGNRTNRIPVGAVTTNEGASNIDPAQASLTNLPGASVSKAFAPNPISAGAYSILTITIQNTGNIPLTGMSLTDMLPGSLPAGLAVAGSPAPGPTNSCNGTVTAVPGTQSIQLTGGSLAANSSCDIVVSVTGSTPGNYENCIPVGALTNDQNATNNQAACDTLQVQGQGTSGITKTLVSTSAAHTSGSDVTIGEQVTYQVVVSIAPGTYTNARLIDTLDPGLAFVQCDSIDGGSLTATAGSFASICQNPTTDDAGGGTTADIDRRVTFNFGTLTNNDAQDVPLTLTYAAIVLDIASNVDGVTRNNSALFVTDQGNSGPAQTTVRILEPKLTVDKTADTSFLAIDTEATITLTVAHAANSHLDAFDAELTDPLPTGMDYVPNSLDCTTGAQDPTTCVVDTSNPAQPVVRATWDVFTLNGGTSLIRFRVSGNSSLPVNGSVTNIANLSWTSLPEDNPPPNSFSNPPNPFAVERFFDPGSPIDIYGTSDPFIFNPVGGSPPDPDPDPEDPSRRPRLGGFLIPVTGFAPNQVTVLEGTQPTYTSTGLTIEIPKLKLTVPVMGIPLRRGIWNVNWLWNEAGWLDKTAYPTFPGNSVITGHDVTADGFPGPFARIKQLLPGDYIFVHFNGYRYTYQVMTNKYVAPHDISILRHEEKSWITLVTCDTYDVTTGTYLKRVVVRSVLIDVEEE
ncbi:MAG: sortase, partial [Chloroflexota bacterium]